MTNAQTEAQAIARWKLWFDFTMPRMKRNIKGDFVQYKDHTAALAKKEAELVTINTHRHKVLAENERLRNALIDRDRQLAAKEAELAEMRAYAFEATKAITSLTVGGSEFFWKRLGDIYTADLPYCVEHIKNRERRAHERWLDERKERQRAEAQLAEANKALERHVRRAREAQGGKVDG